MKNIHLPDEEAKLLRSLRRSETTAWEELYKRCYKMTEQLVLTNSGTQSDARDLFQDSLIALHRLIRKPDFQLTAKLSTLLFSISKNLWLKKLSKQGKMRIVAEPIDIPELDLDTYGVERSNNSQLQEALKGISKLGEKCQQVIKYFYSYRWSLQDIAEHFDWSYDYAKKRRMDCMKKLKKLILPTSQEN